MAYAPCKNPNCKSYGRPHPNCRCYGDMSEGGEVAHYCVQGKPHQDGCEYFADGGIAESDIEVNPRAATAIPDADIVPDHSPGIPESDIQLDSEKYGTAGQQIGAGIEGLAQGVAGPLATAAELGLSKLGVPGMSAEDIRGRAEANPWTHGIAETAGLIGGSLIPGVGGYTLGSAALKAGAAAADLTKFGAIGTKLITGAIASGALQASDEATKHMLDDPTAAAASSLAHIGAAGLFGLGGAAAAMGVGKASKVIADAAQDIKIGDRLRGFAQGLGAHSSGNAEALKPQLNVLNGVLDDTPLLATFKKEMNPDIKKGFDAGEVLWNKLGHAMGGGAASFGALGAYKGYEENGIAGALKEGAMDAVKGAIGGAALKAAGQKIIAPVILNAMQTGKFNNIVGALNHQAAVAKGVNAINTGVESLFAKVPQQIYNSYVTDQNRDALKDYISNGGITQNIQQQIYKDNATTAVPQFAEGGLVKEMPTPKPSDVAPILDAHPGVADHFPTQNVILNSARGRISNYLSSLQPQKTPQKLAFDDIPKDKQAERNYDKAIDIALNPLSVLQHVKAGTIEPQQIKHLNAMYPEVVTQVQKKLTERITEAQLKNEKPAYQTRLGMSMMLGTPLDSSMTPANIQAIQIGFAPKQPVQQGPQGDNKGSKKSLEKAPNQYRMGDESRILNKAKG